MPTDHTDTSDNTQVAVIISENAPELERFAAEQLCDYLEKLFDLQTRPMSNLSSEAETLFLVGNLDVDIVIQDTMAESTFQSISKQGFILRRVQFRGRPSLMVRGGSPRATLWAVYELVERWGVRYLLHGDVLPETRTFRLPDLNIGMEPVLSIRQWRVINDFACGPESWGIGDYRPVLDQLI